MGLSTNFDMVNTSMETRQYSYLMVHKHSYGKTPFQTGKTQYKWPLSSSYTISHISINIPVLSHHYPIIIPKSNQMKP